MRKARLPSTFLYNKSCEDFDAYRPHLTFRETDRCLTITGGGCNSLEILLQGVAHVVSVDFNPAQTALLELKMAGLKRLPYEDFWALLGEGRHSKVSLLLTDLLPHMSTASASFWKSRDNLDVYRSGSMGKITCHLRLLALVIPFDACLAAHNLEEQQRLWKHMQRDKWFQLFLTFLSSLATDENIWWNYCGIPRSQIELLQKDGQCIFEYMLSVLGNVAMHSHIKTANHFYYNMIRGEYSRENCPAYLRQCNFDVLRRHLHRLDACTGLFEENLRDGLYDKIFAMDHMDWLTEAEARILIRTMWLHTKPGANVILCSSALRPFYIDVFVETGFQTKCINRKDQCGPLMDRVNMYASQYCCTRP
jgi:betaine lipid synthase